MREILCHLLKYTINFGTTKVIVVNFYLIAKAKIEPICLLLLVVFKQSRRNMVWKIGLVRTVAVMSELIFTLFSRPANFCLKIQCQDRFYQIRLSGPKFTINLLHLEQNYAVWVVQSTQF